MADDRNPGTFTGKHMALVFIGGFGVVIAVNLVMAGFAVSSFHGVVVENSYVASQKFNGWMDKAEQSRALGWAVEPQRLADGRIALATTGVPAGATITAIARRPLGAHETVDLRFVSTATGAWVSDTPLAGARWTLHVNIAGDGTVWSGEAKLP